MAFSFSRLIIPESDIFTYKKAIDFIEKSHAEIKQIGTASCVGESDAWKVWLGFRKGIPLWECSCTDNTYPKNQKPCFHVLSVSLLWDRSRNVPDPSQEDVEFLSDM
ncbi:MAG: hypothetical protein A2836_00490 [Candidatus Taylorbacteria bacterium RIFCSPHIGHO2_01_FULL_45_63]|uniref:SWIM-type domain-containing protein n=1 Tax=Candidatus Taylorbacteria bacterium RIFCSPHIGHO2_02_FULL_45_35 TaxID=1802311 RepID=A0A1G2MPF9_9BACT|nr:MAG: hypothetical protein A2836_00490 [Candidatus Taylorbacteria bacterium RIFCSPHIGHO2_01_FULL_45_63]OHA25746.1 MAG: hypothetical protein A3D56_03270 [Candidatus Taylorbacteria bacterium RIFCSPHIGHO2_02_FULL_45_35]OHA34814.1 MAG: hypothetical protein A3A22_00280 [Candidatus Taylorbacteria bacterium RIFCSPLOWO2_01_FULL_45_34b]